ncbi:MAG TPA: CotH kinase family protein [Polyangiaceae bacterium]|nr:CotH kinase family protein [Polyangiaceae bacterium]
MREPCRGRVLAGLHLIASALLMACSGEPADASGPGSMTVQFSPGAGTFVDSQTVSLSVGNSQAEIHFTLDGSAPTPNSPIYDAPLDLAKSTRIRAIAVAPSAMAGAGAQASMAELGPVAGQDYLRVASDAASFSSNLPILVIHTFESGVINPNNEEFVPATLELREPAAGTTALVGRASLDTRIGIHVRGETSRDFPKKQYAVEFRELTSDDDVDQPLLGLPADSDWVISDPITMDRSLIRNALGFALSNRIGRYAPRTRFVEVFLADSGGDVRNQDFLGFYTLIEKIKRGDERVDVHKLLETDIAEPNLNGGYMLRIDKGANDFTAGGQGMQFVYPDPEVMRVPARKAQVDYVRGLVDAFAQAENAADFKQPSTGLHYSEFIDVDAWIDHNIVNALTKNVDALRISAYFYKDRGGHLAAGPVWDFDRSLGTPYDDRAKAPEEWKRAGSDGSDYFGENFWKSLFRDPAFKARYKARFLALLSSEFAPEKLTQMVDEMVTTIGPAADRNFKRWTMSQPQGGVYQNEIALLKDFLVKRVAFIRADLAKWP